MSFNNRWLNKVDENLAMGYTTQTLKSERDLYVITRKDAQNILLSNKKEVIHSIFYF